MLKKMLKDTIGVSIGGVGISQAKTISSPLAPAISTTMAGGLAMRQANDVFKKKRK